MDGLQELPESFFSYDSHGTGEAGVQPERGFIEAPVAQNDGSTYLFRVYDGEHLTGTTFVIGRDGSHLPKDILPGQHWKLISPDDNSWALLETDAEPLSVPGDV